MKILRDRERRRRREGGKEGRKERRRGGELERRRDACFKTMSILSHLVIFRVNMALLAKLKNTKKRINPTG